MLIFWSINFLLQNAALTVEERATCGGNAPPLQPPKKVEGGVAAAVAAGVVAGGVARGVGRVLCLIFLVIKEMVNM